MEGLLFLYQLQLDDEELVDLDPTLFALGFLNDIDHGLKLKANLRLPVVQCSVCGGTHD